MLFWRNFFIQFTIKFTKCHYKKASYSSDQHKYSQLHIY